jgi:hypothetical protein
MIWISTAQFSSNRLVAASPLKLLLLLLSVLLLEQLLRVLSLLQILAVQRTWMMMLSLSSLIPQPLSQQQDLQQQQ